MDDEPQAAANDAPAFAAAAPPANDEEPPAAAKEPAVDDEPQAVANAASADDAPAFAASADDAPALAAAALPAHDEGAAAAEEEVAPVVAVEAGDEAQAVAAVEPGRLMRGVNLFGRAPRGRGAAAADEPAEAQDPAEAQESASFASAAAGYALDEACYEACDIHPQCVLPRSHAFGCARRGDLGGQSVNEYMAEQPKIEAMIAEHDASLQQAIAREKAAKEEEMSGQLAVEASKESGGPPSPPIPLNCGDGKTSPLRALVRRVSPSHGGRLTKKPKVEVVVVSHPPVPLGTRVRTHAHTARPSRTRTPMLCVLSHRWSYLVAHVSMMMSWEM